MPCLDCGRPTRGAARCAEHERAANRRRAAKSRAHGLTLARWRREIRPRVLERDGGFCALALRGCTRVATSVHRLPEFGAFHDSNLDAYVSACAHCHGVVDGRRS